MATMTATEIVLQPPGIATRDISIRAADGYPLAATLFEPAKASTPLHYRAGSRCFEPLLRQVRHFSRREETPVGNLDWFGSKGGHGPFVRCRSEPVMDHHPMGKRCQCPGRSGPCRRHSEWECRTVRWARPSCKRLPLARQVSSGRAEPAFSGFLQLLHRLRDVLFCSKGFRSLPGAVPFW